MDGEANSPSDGENDMSGGFFYYHAGHLAIDASRPWQVCSLLGCVLAKLDSEAKAIAAVDALTEDKQKGILPCNLSTWDRKSVLEN